MCATNDGAMTIQPQYFVWGEKPIFMVYKWKIFPFLVMDI